MDTYQLVLKEVNDAFNVIFDPNASHNARSKANETLRSLEENSKTYWPLSFQLSTRENSPSLRHFGLHLLENFIKRHWNKISETDQLEIRNKLIFSIKNDLFDICTESLFIKECYAKCLAEIAKKEYPQKWPLFLDDCNAILSLGLAQCQVVLFLWTRLFEDVIVLQNVEPLGRRRDLHNSIISQIDKFLDFSHRILTETWSKLINNNNESALKLCVTNLEFLAIVLEFIPASDFQPYCDNLFNIFCQQIKDDRLEIRKLSAECLSRFVVAKYTRKEEEIFVGLSVFTINRMSLISGAIQKTLNDTIKDDEYACLRKSSSMLLSFGTNLCHCWNSDIDKDNDKLESIEIFLNLIFTFLRHPSLVLRSQAGAVCNFLIKNEEFMKSKLSVKFLSQLVELIPSIIQLIGFPSKDESLFSEYSRIEFDTDLDFLTEFCKFREMCISMVKRSVKIDHRFVYKLIFDWFVQKFDKNVDSIQYQEWDAIIRCISNFINSIVNMDLFKSDQFKNDSKLFFGITLNNLKNRAKTENADLILSTLSTLFPFLVFHWTYIPEIVVQLFRLVLWEDDGSETCRRLRHHAMHEFVHLALEQTDYLLPYIDDIIAEMEKHAHVLTLRQNCCLAEAFTVISNKFNDFLKQKKMVEYCISVSVQYFASSDIVNACSSPSNFAKFIGLFDFTTEIITPHDIYFNRRKDILSHTIMLVGVLNRLVLPKNVEKAKEYGFISELDGKIKINHPAFDIFLSICPHLFSLARCINGLYSKEILANIHPSYGGAKILDLIDVEKNFNLISVITSQPQDKEGQSMADQLRCFVADFTEKIQIVLGLIVSKFNWQFYQLPQAVNFLTFGVLGHLEDCLDQRLRFWIRRFFAPVVESVGSDDRRIVLPSLSILVNHVFERLTNRWSLILRRLQENDDNGKNLDDLTNQEIFLEDLTRLFTREYLNFLKSALFRRKFYEKRSRREENNAEFLQNDEANDDFGQKDEPNFDENDQETQNIEMDQLKTSHNDINPYCSKLSELGVDLLDQKYDCVGSLTLTVFHALTWLDTQAVAKACELGIVIMHQLLKTKVLDEQKVEHLFKCPLNSVQIHGEHDMPFANLLGLLCDMYEALSPEFSCIKRILMELPDFKMENLERYDQKWMATKACGTKLPIKTRRDLFKRIIYGIIGKNIGQKYKSKITYNLKLPIFLNPKQNKRYYFDAESSRDLGICSLFGSQEG